MTRATRREAENGQSGERIPAEDIVLPANWSIAPHIVVVEVITERGYLMMTLIGERNYTYHAQYQER
jgi:hypothetical protein